MQVNPNLSTAPVAKVSTPNPVSALPKPKSDTEFSATDALDGALAQVPDVREHEVARATKLVESSTYPPPEFIRRLSRLVALHVDKPTC